MKIFENLVNNEDFWNLIKLEDYSNFSHNRRFLKIRSKLKIFQSLVKIEDFWKLDKIFQILAKRKKNPSTDETQCCLTLEIQNLIIIWKLGFRSRRSHGDLII